MCQMPSMALSGHCLLHSPPPRTQGALTCLCEEAGWERFESLLRVMGSKWPVHTGHHIACPSTTSYKPRASTCICPLDCYTCPSLPGSPIQGKLKGAWSLHSQSSPPLVLRHQGKAQEFCIFSSPPPQPPSDADGLLSPPA